MGDRIGWLSHARRCIARDLGTFMQVSSIYETAPWGNQDQPPFLNQAVWISTRLSPEKILDLTKGIEHNAGRDRVEKWGPRTLDIDILFYNDRIIQSDDLTIPHPMIPYRRFALVPLLEIAPDLVHPVLHLPIRELLTQTPDHSEVAIFPT